MLMAIDCVGGGHRIDNIDIYKQGSRMAYGTTVSM